jgi:hypothetical protein
VTLVAGSQELHVLVHYSCDHSRLDSRKDSSDVSKVPKQLTACKQKDDFLGRPDLAKWIFRKDRSHLQGSAAKHKGPVEVPELRAGMPSNGSWSGEGEKPPASSLQPLVSGQQKTGCRATAAKHRILPTAT